MSIVLIGLGLVVFFLPVESSRPLPSTALLQQFLISLILIGAGIIILIAQWRR